jgi:hypothetical protein
MNEVSPLGDVTFLYSENCVGRKRPKPILKHFPMKTAYTIKRRQVGYGILTVRFEARAPR